MAEFCDECAENLGFEKEDYPLFCEGCATYFEPKKRTKSAQNRLKNRITKILNMLKIRLYKIE